MAFLFIIKDVILCSAQLPLYNFNYPPGYRDIHTHQFLKPMNFNGFFSKWNFRDVILCSAQPLFTTLSCQVRLIAIYIESYLTSHL